MADLIPTRRPRSVLSRLEREVVGEIEAAQARSLVVAAQECARIDAASAVAHRALSATGQINAHEWGLMQGQTDEWAAYRLRRVADASTSAIERITESAGRRI